MRSSSIPSTVDVDLLGSKSGTPVITSYTYLAICVRNQHVIRELRGVPNNQKTTYRPSRPIRRPGKPQEDED